MGDIGNPFDRFPLIDPFAAPPGLGKSETAWLYEALPFAVTISHLNWEVLLMEQEEDFVDEV